MSFIGNGKTFTVDRRKFMLGAAALVAAGVLPKQVLALAGPVTFKQGNFDVTVVSDGQLVLPAAIVASNAPPEDVKKLIAMLLTGDNITVQASPVLLKSASDLILLDTGAGSGFQASAGKIVETLKLAGVDPAAVTRVIYTHAHPDHIWGTAANGALTFPNASYHIAENEWNFWGAPDLAGKMPKEMQGMVTGTQAQFAAIKDKVAMFKPGSEVIPGMNVLDTPGHTPGHVSFELAGGDGLIITADAITIPEVFFAHPDYHFGFDSDGDLASKSRVALLDMAAAGKKKMLGYHWTGTGMGYAEKKDGAFVYVPA